MAMASPNVMIVSDLDHTMVQNEDKAAKRQLAFNHLWTTHCASNPDSLLVFSTGRSPKLFKALWQEAPLLTPDVLICSVGTEVFYNTRSPVARLLLGSSSGAAAEPAKKGDADSAWAQFAPDPKWESVLDEGWSRERVQQLVSSCSPQLVPQAASEQRPHKLSYILPPSARTAGSSAIDEPIIKKLREALAAEGLAAKVVYSGGQDVDVLASRAGKGCGLAFLLGRLREVGYKLEHVQVNGDSGNDAELLDVEGVVGCVVSNAHPELRHYAEAKAQQGDTHVLQASNPCAGGIIEAMLHFGLLRRCTPLLTAYTSTGLLQLPGHDSTSQDGAAAEQLPRTGSRPQHEHPSTPPPGVAEKLPPPGASGVCGTSSVEPPPSEALPIMENRPEVEEAARKVGSGWTPDAPGVGDACLQYGNSGVPEQLAGVDSGPAPPIVVSATEQLHGGATETAGTAAQQLPKGVLHGKICGLGKEEAVREWVWRLGGALLLQLAVSKPPGTGTGTSLDNAPAGSNAQAAAGEAGEKAIQLPSHSPLRLFVSNSCRVVWARRPTVSADAETTSPVSVFVTGDAGSSAAAAAAQSSAVTPDPVAAGDGQVGAGSTGARSEPGAAVLEAGEAEGLREGGSEDPAEVAHDLQAEGAADAAARDAHSLLSRTWVDQVAVTLNSNNNNDGATAAGEGNDADGQPLYTFTASFKICVMKPDGYRSDQLVWGVHVEGIAPKEPVPHGYLASRISVVGPLDPQQQQLGLPQCE